MLSIASINCTKCHVFILSIHDVVFGNMHVLWKSGDKFKQVINMQSKRLFTNLKIQWRLLYKHTHTAKFIKKSNIER